MSVKRMILAGTIFLMTTSLGLAQGIETSGSSQEFADRVRQAALVTWIHGITEEISTREIGLAGVPVLLTLLKEPDFPRRDNIVAHLTWLGGDLAASRLLEFMENPPAGVIVPEEDRALLLAPRALGHIASRGSVDAMVCLEKILAKETLQDVHTAAMVVDLVDSARYGLGIAGSEGGILPLGAGDDGTSAGSDLQVDGAALNEPQVMATLDAGATAHEAGLSYANHIDVFFQMDDQGLDESLRLATVALGVADFAAGGSNTEDDVACCLRLVRSGTAGSFGTADDGLDIIDDVSDLNAVLNNNIARVKIVRAINECGGPGTNILACAHTPGASIAMTNSGMSVQQRGLVWAHEYGHNTGLGHNATSQSYLMFASSSSSSEANRGLTQDECNSFHTPPVWTEMNNVDLGSCHDSDLDGVVSGADNCPITANADQTDLDNNGVGDICETCDDTDGDGFGVNGSDFCAGGTTIDCDDGDALVHPDGIEQCDGIDNDCDGALDVFACGDIDISADGSVDGTELAWIGRAFGLSSSTPQAEWWYEVDFTFDGRIDGDDLAVLGGFWGCEGTTKLCN